MCSIRKKEVEYYGRVLGSVLKEKCILEQAVLNFDPEKCPIRQKCAENTRIEIGD